MCSQKTVSHSRRKKLFLEDKNSYWNIIWGFDFGVFVVDRVRHFLKESERLLSL